MNLADELENCRVAAIDDAEDVYDVEDRLCAFYDALTPERQREADAIGSRLGRTRERSTLYSMSAGTRRRVWSHRWVLPRPFRRSLHSRTALRRALTPVMLSGPRR